MNRSKLYEWLLDNDCPWDFIVDDTWKPTESVILTFLEKDKVETQEETEVRDMTDKEYWNSFEIKELLNKDKDKVETQEGKFLPNFHD